MPSGESFPSPFDLSTPFYQPLAPCELNKKGETKAPEESSATQLCWEGTWLAAKQSPGRGFPASSWGSAQATGHGKVTLSYIVSGDSLEDAAAKQQELLSSSGKEEKDNRVSPGGLCMDLRAG